MDSLRCPETSVNIYQHTVLKDPDERALYLHQSGSLQYHSVSRCHHQKQKCVFGAVYEDKCLARDRCRGFRMSHESIERICGATLHSHNELQDESPISCRQVFINLLEPTPRLSQSTCLATRGVRYDYRCKINKRSNVYIT